MTTVTEQSLTLDDSAVRRIAALAAADGRAGLMLRITVAGGGCQGFQYEFGFDDTAGPEDRVFARDGVAVVVDEVSLGLLAGAQLRYVEDLMGSYFRLENPNAVSSCGCGVSFSIG